MSINLLVRKTSTSSAAPKPASSGSDQDKKKLPTAISDSSRSRRDSNSLEKKEEQLSSFGGITTELHLIKTSDLDRDVVLKRIRHHKFRRRWFNHRTTTLSGLDPDDAFSAP